MIRTLEPHVAGTRVAAPHRSLSSLTGLFKHLLDRLAAGLGLLILAPLLVAVAIAIRLDSPGPVFFKQTRVGLGGKLFSIYKFRSMQVDAEARLAELKDRNEMRGPLFKLKQDPRVTRVGRVLRKTSLDELPQLLNVLRGEMSLVGPRPPVPSEVAEYEPWQLEKFAVRPGLTGLWQISGRNELADFDQMIALDLCYIRAWSFREDMRILARTVPVVLLGRGAH